MPESPDAASVRFGLRWLEAAFWVGNSDDGSFGYLNRTESGVEPAHSKFKSPKIETAAFYENS